MYGSKTALRSTHAVLELLISMIPSILILNLTEIYSHFLPFRALIGSFWGWGTHVFEQHLFSMFSSSVAFDFTQFLGNFLLFGP